MAWEGGYKQGQHSYRQQQNAMKMASLLLGFKRGNNSLHPKLPGHNASAQRNSKHRPANNPTPKAPEQNVFALLHSHFWTTWKGAMGGLDPAGGV